MREEWRLWEYHNFVAIYLSNRGNIKSDPKGIGKIIAGPDGTLRISIPNRKTAILKNEIAKLWIKDITGLAVTLKNGDNSDCSTGNILIGPPKIKSIDGYFFVPGRPKSKNWNGPRSVIQCDKGYKFIRIYPSIATASRELNMHGSEISRVCKGKRKTARGFIWFYKTNPPRIFYKINPKINLVDIN